MVVVILLNVFKMNIVVCLLAGILLSLVFLFLMGAAPLFVTGRVIKRRLEKAG